MNVNELRRTPKINCIYSTRGVRCISFSAALVRHNWLITRKSVCLSLFSSAGNLVFRHHFLHEGCVSCLCLRLRASSPSHVVVGQLVGWKAGGLFHDLFSQVEKLT